MVSNLVHLPEEGSEAICRLLQERFKHDLPYTQLGNHCMVVVNPLKALDLLDDATLQTYANQGYKDLLANVDGFATLEPHVYDFATRVYFVMRRRCEDQTIVLSGLSGSGKTTTHRHLLKELLLLSTHTRREEKIRQQITSATTILEAFGSAVTATNDSATQLGRFHTLQFNERGRIVGAQVQAYAFDKSLVTRTRTANYHIFYQLLAGTTADEKRALHIDHAADHFAYLKQHTSRHNEDRDAIAFGDVKEALKTCGFKAKTVAQMCQLLGAILHLGNIQFVDANKSFGGVSLSSTGGSGQESCRIKNKDTLSLVAAALGVATAKLENTLTHKLKLIGKEFCTAFLTVDTATQQRDGLARTLYSILVLWIMDTLNRKLGAPSSSSGKSVSAIHILDFLAVSPAAGPQASTFHDLCVHFAAENLRQCLLEHHFGVMRGPDDAPSPPPPPAAFFASSNSLFTGTNGNPMAIIPSLNRESQRFQAYALDATDANWLTTLFQKKKANDADFRSLKPASAPNYSFAIQHYGGTVDYSVDGFLESNLDAVSPNFVHLFRYSCTNSFVQKLFVDSTILTETHPRDERTVIKAQMPTCFTTDTSLSSTGISCVFEQVERYMKGLVERVSTTGIFEIIHIRPNDEGKPDLFDSATVQQQLQAYRVPECTRRFATSDTMYGYTFSEFLVRYRHIIHALPLEPSLDDRSKIERLIDMMHWPGLVLLGEDKVWLHFEVWRDLENHLRVTEKEARVRDRERQAAMEAEKEAQRIAAEAARTAAEAEAEEAAEAEAAAAAAAAEAAMATATLAAAGRGSDEHANPFDDDRRSDVSNDFYDDRTDMDGLEAYKGSEWGDDDDARGLAEGFGPNMDMSKMVEDYNVQAEVQIEEVPITSIRQWWARFVWLSTWWIPSFALRWFGKMRRQDVQMAWREKVTLCLLIFLFSGSIIFLIVGFGEVICPGTKYLFSAQDVAGHQTISDYWVSVRGKVFDVTKFAATDHGTSSYMAGKANMEPLAGRDLSYTFPPPLTVACAGLVTDDSISLIPNETVVLGPFIHQSGNQQPDHSFSKLRDPHWMNKYFGPTMQLYKKGDLVVRMKQIQDDFKGWGRLIASIDERVYDITDYMVTARRYPRGGANAPNYHFLDESVETLFIKFGGQDATQEWRKYSNAMDPETRARNQACLDNMFYIGRLDYRESARCTAVNYMLLSFAVIMSLVILVKFLAALQFGGAPTPEDHEKFVICQVPCYTEDEESLRKTIDSLTAMTYDDRRKLLFLIADGMIIGSGNDKPTPRILLDILGHNAAEDSEPEPLMFKSVGEGSKQLNYGKVYSGIYQHEGHTVPYVVVVKVGKSTESTKPGNRGKRDSQIICMNFLSKVHFDTAMTPLELEIYFHIRHVIGIDPSLYEYILMVDSDTEVYPDALNRLISCMLHDSRIIGLCGETELCNEDGSWATMIQVYEYYISHHLVKAFESLFGSVTCLPGCFCMYRIRTANKRQPLIVAPAVIHGYSDNQVDTLHKKNLLHLGEDRYLTTLMMKNFPQYKMMFTPYAKCRTVAPDQWRVLLSQRRRWINSTIHNLLELILLPELCGFCCLSMRFVVMMDLIGTITLPSSVVYLVYLIWEAASNTGPIPMIAIGMLAGAYGLQALIFIMKRQWQHIGWMVIYVLAIPIFSFFIPIYAFWHFDDFSWGSTRVVVGDKKKQIIVTDDEKFDEKMIPLKRWAQYEQELWEAKSEADCSEKMTKHDGDEDHQSCYTSEPHGSVEKARLVEQSLLPPLLSTQHQSDFSVDLSAALHPNGPPGVGTHTTTPMHDAAEHDNHPLTLPEDEELEREIERILATANLMTLTKKQVRDQLSRLFGMDLTIKKGFINATIERLLE